MAFFLSFHSSINKGIYFFSRTPIFLLRHTPEGWKFFIIQVWSLVRLNSTILLVFLASLHVSLCPHVFSRSRSLCEALDDFERLRMWCATGLDNQRFILWAAISKILKKVHIDFQWNPLRDDSIKTPPPSIDRPAAIIIEFFVLRKSNCNPRV